MPASASTPATGDEAHPTAPSPWTGGPVQGSPSVDATQPTARTGAGPRTGPAPTARAQTPPPPPRGRPPGPQVNSTEPEPATRPGAHLIPPRTQPNRGGEAGNRQVTTVNHRRVVLPPFSGRKRNCTALSAPDGSRYYPHVRSSRRGATWPQPATSHGQRARRQVTEDH
jgi:hypothetical protein